MGFRLANLDGRAALVHGDHYLVDGDVVVTAIHGIGSISNRCVRVNDHHSSADRWIS